LDWGDIAVNPATPAPVYITDCVFTGSVLTHINAYEGMDLRITNSVIGGQRGAAIFVNDNTGGDRASTVSLVGNVVDTGTTVASATDNPAGLFANTVLRFTPVIVNRNTFRGVDTGATTPSWIQHGSAIRLGRVRDGSITITNNVIEGSDFAIVSDPAVTFSQASPNVINNTIIGLADGASSITVYVPGINAQAPVIRNSVILGYPILKNVAGGTTSSLHLDADGEPGFIAPYPFAPPAAAGMSDYHLRGVSPLIDAVTTTSSLAQIDRDGNDRGTTGTLWDIGAYEFQAGANPVNHWTWFGN
jgi:hypothetical protein